MITGRMSHRISDARTLLRRLKKIAATRLAFLKILGIALIVHRLLFFVDPVRSLGLMPGEVEGQKDEPNLGRGAQNVDGRVDDTKNAHHTQNWIIVRCLDTAPHRGGSQDDDTRDGGGQGVGGYSHVLDTIDDHWTALSGHKRDGETKEGKQDEVSDGQ